MARPMKAATLGQKPTVSIQLSPDEKNWLDATARAHGHGQSAEFKALLARHRERQSLAQETLGLVFGEGTAGLAYIVGKLMQEVALARLRRVYRNTVPPGSWWEDPDGYEAGITTAIRVLEEFRPEGALTFAPNDPECAREVEAYVLGRLTPALSGEPYPDGQREFVELARTLLGDLSLQSRWLRERLALDAADMAARANQESNASPITIEDKIAAGRRLIAELVTTPSRRRREHLRGILDSLSKVEEFDARIRAEFAAAATAELPEVSTRTPATRPWLVPSDAASAHPFHTAWLIARSLALGRTHREPSDDEIAQTLADDLALLSLANLHHGPATAASILKYRAWLIDQTAQGPNPPGEPSSPMIEASMPWPGRPGDGDRPRQPSRSPNESKS